MSNNDSFIDEVSEEVRRERLFHLLRRYGWIAIVVVVLLVGGAAFWEYQRAQDRAEAAAFGDGIVAALALETPEERRDALLSMEAQGTRRALVVMLAADQLEDDTARQTTRDELDAIASEESLPQIYRQLAVLKSVMLAQADTAPEEVISRLDPLTAPGAPYRLLAVEQQALAHVRAGDRDAAIALLGDILSADELTRDLQQRARQLTVALGGSLDAT
ncbi:hypothetical protein [Palleronia sp. LCG004]|uniref:hypothetical protein n=1 Tax=Palleronia sp. LCG004 TaxID=3079304 RepID=UPI0029436C58|nr:hypothetical protein [Palleronia sp. LCG004]WOI54864.1 hypothetical protein RVY76_07250 [Palleronia sp. LCG004]